MNIVYMCIIFNIYCHVVLVACIQRFLLYSLSHQVNSKCSGTALAFKAVLGVFLFIGLCLLLFIENPPIIKLPQ